MKKKGLILAFVFSTTLSLLVGLLSNLAAAFLAPDLQNQPWIIYVALSVTFIVALPVSTYLFVHSFQANIISTRGEGDNKDTIKDKTTVDFKTYTNTIPEKPYRELVGRDLLIGEVISALRDPGGKWIIGIDGIGGIGKTALALEVANHCFGENLFNTVLWEQAPKEREIVISHSRVESLTFESILDSIARQMGQVEVPYMRLSDKANRVRALIKNRRVLLVLDNMETSKESQNDIAKQLLPLLNPSKVILTSRHRFDEFVYSLHLQGLEVDAALRFIRNEAQEKNIKKVISASEAELRKIARSTGGSPLAIKLIIGQLVRLPIDVVLRQLQEVAPPKGEDEESEYTLFYKSIFIPSWNLLTEDSKQLLISMAKFAPNVGATYEALERISGLPEENIPVHIDELWRLSFLEIAEAQSLRRVRYYLHALTQYFVLSDIVKVL